MGSGRHARIRQTKKGSYQRPPASYDPSEWAGTVNMTNAERYVLVQAHKKAEIERRPSAATR